MKKIILLFILTFNISSCTAQEKRATKNASGDLIGITARADFDQQPYTKWFQPNYNNFTVDKSTVKKLKKALRGVTIKAFMGTWCGDSKRETPKLYKLLNLADFNLRNLEMVTVNRAKRTPDNLQKDHNILRVPTFIFYKKGEEIGRFVEYSRETLEKDILKILTGQKYKHSYDHTK